MKAATLPPELGRCFATATARSQGVSPSRLRAVDLESPFRGARLMRVRGEDPGDRYRAAHERELSLIDALATRLVKGQFFSHRSAALLWGLPVPYRARPELHLGVLNPQRSPRYRQVQGHCFESKRVRIVRYRNLPVLAPASVFATLGSLTLPELVAVGDHLVRVYRPGVGRREVGRAPIARLEDLQSAIDLGHWHGMPRLRQALELIRPDSWSPRESITRVILVLGGLPEPELNVDVFGEHGNFIACVDMVYPQFRVIIEYQGDQHKERFALDVERVEALRSEGWDVIQVTRVLARDHELLVARVRKALIAGGWRG